MTFEEFLKTRPRYQKLVILEERGDKTKIEKKVAQFGMRTQGRVLIYNQETSFISKNPIYKTSTGYRILWSHRKIPYENFKIKE
ncbi:Transposase [Fusobacterium necrophorum subsp. funduliforme]|uniref:hypothetical protein n=1 Tax=Fusobacterium necrophorum TaxID=859 RepID=UPI0007884851|nr:hypothetical protein [Fusobacterium necrophorum]KYM50750.1 hypothetical protein A2U11_08570 [Fusobacterium necrophorum subsp. funduliforme]